MCMINDKREDWKSMSSEEFEEFTDKIQEWQEEQDEKFRVHCHDISNQAKGKFAGKIMNGSELFRFVMELKKDMLHWLLLAPDDPQLCNVIRLFRSGADSTLRVLEYDEEWLDEIDPAFMTIECLVNEGVIDVDELNALAKKRKIEDFF